MLRWRSLTAHLNEKNLSTNSSWGFEHVLDTMNYYWLCPDDWFVHSTLPTRWRCNQFSKKWPKSKSDTTFTNKKTSVTPTFCKRNFSGMHRFGFMNFLSSLASSNWTKLRKKIDKNQFSFFDLKVVINQ